MAILRSVDDKFYQIPDEQLELYQVPQERVAAERGTAVAEPEAAGEELETTGEEGEKFLRWRNRWRNYWHNYWRNYY